MDVTKQLRDRRQDILDLAAKYGARNVRIFGSVARGEAGAASDVDLLVDFDENRSLFDVVGLTQDLEELLGRKVDVVTEESVYWLIRRRVLNEAKVL